MRGGRRDRSNIEQHLSDRLISRKIVLGNEAKMVMQKDKSADCELSELSRDDDFDHRVLRLTSGDARCLTSAAR